MEIRQSYHNFICSYLGGIQQQTLALLWHHNGHDGISNHWHLDCLLKRLFRADQRKQQSALSLAFVYSLVTGEFPAQRASNAKNVSIWWHHHGVVANFPMMTSSNGNIFSVTGKFTGDRWIPRTKDSDAGFDVFFDLHLNKRLRKQSWGWWFEMPSCPLWGHCNCNVNPSDKCQVTITCLTRLKQHLWTIRPFPQPLIQSDHKFAHVTTAQCDLCDHHFSCKSQMYHDILKCILMVPQDQ